MMVRRQLSRSLVRSLIDFLFSQENETSNNQSQQFTWSLSHASFNYINAIIGSGVIGIPYALHKAGFGLGLLLLIFVAVVTDYSLILMVSFLFFSRFLLGISAVLKHFVRGHVFEIIQRSVMAFSNWIVGFKMFTVKAPSMSCHGITCGMTQQGRDVLLLFYED